MRVRILWLQESATKTRPAASTERPAGPENRAAVPMPLVEPSALPARVVTARAGEIIRMRRLLVSETYITPALVTVMPAGPLKRAAVPTASVEPNELPAAPPPAMVFTVKFAQMRRILLLPVSATSTVAEAPAATARGPLNLAFGPTPSMVPLNPMLLPATAKTVALLGNTARI